MHRLLLALVFAFLAAEPRGAAAQPTPLARRPLSAFPEANAPATAPRRVPPPRRLPALPELAESGALSRDLDAALGLDAAARTILGQREAVRARQAQVRSPIAGSPAIGSDFRSDARGPYRASEWNVELAAPMWLPGQRSALAGTVTAGIEEQDRRLALRRLELAGLLRNAYWAANMAEADRRVAADRLATARDIGQDVQRRVDLGDIARTEALLARSEELAAELELVRAEAAVAAARAAYRTLTGGSDAALLPGTASARPTLDEAPGMAHPAIRAAESALAAAEARAQLVAATPIDNPELGVFTRGQSGPVTEQNTSVGLRVRIPLPTEARNAPRRADAAAERNRTEAELIQTRRIVAGEIGLARLALAAAEQTRRLAGDRRAVTEQQQTAARTAFRSGEIGAFDLFRVRQLQIEAQAVDARAQVEVGRMRSRLSQALGQSP